MLDRKYQYIYQYKNQVGNTCLSYWVHPDENILKILDKNDYYPFGMNILQDSEFNATASPLNYKFGGKELQESGMYDFCARTYMPDLGRWMSIDPLAELSPDLTPFRFAFNNPISFTDPKGMYEDDYEDNYAGNFDIDFTPDNWNFNRSDFWNILNFRWDMDIDIRSGSHNASGSQDDFMADMGSEYSSEANESESQVEQNCCPDPQPNFPGYRQSLPIPALVMMDSPWDILGIFLANSEPRNKYVAYGFAAAAMVVSKGRSLKGQTKVFRAVDNAELASINKTGNFFTIPGGTQAKYLLIY